MQGVRLGHYFEKLVLNDAAFEIPAERILGLIVFRLKVSSVEFEFKISLPQNVI